MTASETRRAKELFLRAVDLSGAERAGFLEELRAGDPSLCERVQRLLAAHGDATSAERGEPAALLDALRKTLWDDGRAVGSVMGDYEILEEIAAGGAGVVYRARQITLGRTVALKVLRAGRFASEKEVERFRAEAESVARLDHPHIVPVHEVGEHKGRHFFSMKLIEGGSLEDRAASFGDDPCDAARLMVLVARAVHHGHQRGLLHRDLKPSNILIDDAGTPYVTDFGIAKRIDEDEGVTATEWLAGTPSFMAPEQATARSGELTVTTDVWAMGCILYQLLAGRAPFRGDSVAEILIRVRDEEPARLSSLRAAVPRPLEVIVQKCLMKDPARRYASAGALADDLERWLRHEPIQASPVTGLQRVQLFWRRKPLVASLATLVAGLVLALALGATWASWRLSESLERAIGAEADAKDKLRASYLAQANAQRQSKEPGRRRRALELLGEAAAIRPGPDLRDEAIACLALVDLEPERRWPWPPGGGSTAYFDRDLERAAVGQPDGTIIVQRAGGEIARTLAGTGTSVWTMAWSADGRRLAAKYHHPDSQGRDAHFRVWDVERGVELLSFPTSVATTALDLDPAGRHAVVGTRDGEVLVWDVDTGGEVLRLDVGQAPRHLRFRPDGGAFALALLGDRVELRAFPAGDLLDSLELPRFAYDVEWSADGSLLATACADFRAYLWDLRARRLHAVLAGHQAEVVSAQLCPGAPFAATHSWDGTTRLWDAMTGQLVVSGTARAGSFSSDGRRLSFTDREGLGIWSFRRDEVQRVLHGHAAKSPRLVALSPDGRWLVSGGPDGALLWDLRAERQVGWLATEDVFGVTFRATDGRLYLSGDDGLVAFAVPAGATSPLDLERQVILDGACATSDISADGRLVAVTQGTRTRFLFDDPTLDREVEAIRSQDVLAVSPDARWVAAGNWKGTGLRVWDARTGEVSVDLHPDRPFTVPCFSRDGRWLVVSVEGLLQFWRTESWERGPALTGLEWPTGRIGRPTFSASGELMAAAMSSTVIQIFDAQSLELRATLEAPDPQVLDQLAFGPEDRLLVATNPTARIQVWDLERIMQELRARGLGALEPGGDR